MKDGKLPDETGVTSSGQDLVVPLLNRCLKFTEIVEQKYRFSVSHAWPMTDIACSKGKIDERFKDVYDRLIEIRNQLERLTMTQAWSLRETDLFMWQRKLDRIDDSRRDGNFFDGEGHPADLHAQRVSLIVSWGECFANLSADPVVPDKTGLRLHLSASYRVRTGFGGSSANLQPAFNVATMLG